jgi:CheY-like chemotaxis protein
VRLLRGAQEARLVVADTGVGIAWDVLPHVFDRFRQADSSTTRVHGGLGLGLALVRYLVEAHGGTVRAESPGLGGGATFVVTLPLRAGATAAPSGEVADAASLAGASVLIVDDDADTRELLAYALRAAAVKVTVVGSAGDALATLTAEPCDLLISDLSMPAEDGYSLVRRLRELDAASPRRRPAIAVTAHARPDDRRRALAAGFDAYLVKPVEAKDVVALVARLLYT